MDKVIAVRLSEADKQKLEEQASRSRISLSAYVRLQLFNEYE